MAANSFIMSELLCFAKIRTGNIPHVQLGIVLSGFYSETEVLDAKKKLFEVHDKVKPGYNGHRLITR